MPHTKHPTENCLRMPGASAPGGAQLRASEPEHAGSPIDQVLPIGNTKRVPSIIKTVKLPKALAAALTEASLRTGQSESALIREGIERVVGANGGLDMLALLGPELGVGRGPGDLSSSRERMKGYGRARHR
jgi:hypothetical protein